MGQNQTRRQIPRSALADSEAFNKMYLIKSCSKLRATYQIKLLAFKAVETNTKLILKVTKSREFNETLNELLKRCGNAVLREDF
jgi:hypothetical protein